MESDQESSTVDSAQPAAALPLSQYWPRRYNLVCLCFLSTFVCYIDRVNISVAIIPMAEEFGWDQTTRGVVLSSFFYGYLATQVFGGWLADRFGGKIVLGIGVLWWSVFTLLTPPAAAFSFTVLFLARVGMGLGEGVAFPAIYNLYARWVPTQERARAVALNTSGIPLGDSWSLAAHSDDCGQSRLAVGVLYLRYLGFYMVWIMVFSERRYT